ncbi:MAG: hypothetical protein AAGA75_09955 [Cyanobacteria bacterium P01_E01_bin.6]
MNKVLVQILISTVTIIFAIINHLVKFDVITNVLFVVALIPWLSPFLKSAELPGGWKFDFARVQEQQAIQSKEIDRLKFLLEGFLTEDELEHLRRLNRKEAFMVMVDGTTKYFEAELRRLRALGLISNPQGRGIGTLLRSDGSQRDVREHFFITDKGKEYLKLRGSGNEE